jgi:hypothetical protein
MARQTFYDRLSKGIADAITDIREKVVEEPWHGRSLSNPHEPSPQWPQARDQPANTPDSVEHNRDAADLDR